MREEPSPEYAIKRADIARIVLRTLYKLARPSSSAEIAREACSRRFALKITAETCRLFLQSERGKRVELTQDGWVLRKTHHQGESQQ